MKAIIVNDSSALVSQASHLRNLDPKHIKITVGMGVLCLCLSSVWGLGIWIMSRLHVKKAEHTFGPCYSCMFKRLSIPLDHITVAFFLLRLHVKKFEHYN